MNQANKTNYVNPYLAGVLLGLVLLSSFVIAGRGIGASGLMSQTLAHGYAALDINNSYLDERRAGNSIWQSWIVIETLGIFMGAWFSGRLAGRVKKEMVGAEDKTRRTRRILFAIGGGVLMGFAARLARGCTSGQALTGGALLSAGSWIFMIAIFVGAYLAIVLVRREWQ